MAIVTIITGLFARSRKSWFPDIVNLYLGDMLYAFMMFYIISLIIPGKKIFIRALVSLLACYCIETIQLYNASWIHGLRATLPGRLILGSGFLWSDLLAYFVGIALALGASKFAQIHPHTA